MKKTLALLLAVALIVGFMPVTAKADNEPASVTVCLSMSNDAQYLVDCSGQAIAFRELTVPYFDLDNYGLSSFYYNPSCYAMHNPAYQSPGTSATAEDHVTLLHVMIYALEVLYLGNTEAHVLDPDADHSDITSADLNIIGSAGSLYFDQYWGMDENFEYFVDYDCPEGYPGWGATADQILLTNVKNNQYYVPMISIGHFTDWDFFTDSNGIFTFAESNNGGTITETNMVNGSVTLTFMHAYADLIMNDTYTEDNPYDEVPVYCCNINNISSGNVAGWSFLGNTTNGVITITPNDIGATTGRFVVAIPGQPGSEAPYATCSTPGGIIVNLGGNAS